MPIKWPSVRMRSGRWTAGPTSLNWGPLVWPCVVLAQHFGMGSALGINNHGRPPFYTSSIRKWQDGPVLRRIPPTLDRRLQPWQRSPWLHSSQYAISGSLHCAFTLSYCDPVLVSPTPAGWRGQRDADPQVWERPPTLCHDRCVFYLLLIHLSN